MLYLVGRKHADAILAIARTDPDAKVVLIHDAVYLAPAGLRQVFVLKADVERRGIRPMGRVIDDAELVRMIAAERVVTQL